MTESFRRIFHATDFSSASGGALARAIDLSRNDDAELLIAHVLSSAGGPLGFEAYATPEMYEKLEKAIRESAQDRLARLVERAQDAGVRCEGLLLDGLAHEEIVRAARRRGADLIVVGTHGRTGAARLFLGSVAARVLAGAHCPVLTVRGGEQTIQGGRHATSGHHERAS